MISNAYQTSAQYSTKALGEALSSRENSIKQDGTWGQALSARALFIVQVVSSIVSVPLALLALIFAPALALCIEGKKEALNLLKGASWVLAIHLSAIPACLIAAFAPHSLNWRAPLSQVGNCMENCVN